MLGKPRLFHFITTLLLLALSSDMAADDVMIFGNENKPPKVFVEKARNKGILVDIIHCVEKQASLSISLKLMPWKRAYESALAGKAGVMGLSMTDERLALLDYSDVMFIDEVMLVVTKGNEFDYASIEDLKGKRVGGQRGSRYGDKFSKGINVLFTLDEDDSSVSRLKKLLYKRIDVAAIGPGEEGVLAVISKDPFLMDNKEKFSILPTPLKRDPNYLGFSKKMTMKPFLVAFNKGLAECKASGEHQRIVDKYMNP